MQQSKTTVLVKSSNFFMFGITRVTRVISWVLKPTTDQKFPCWLLLIIVVFASQAIGVALTFRMAFNSKRNKNACKTLHIVYGE